MKKAKAKAQAQGTAQGKGKRTAQGKPKPKGKPKLKPKGKSGGVKRPGVRKRVVKGTAKERVPEILRRLHAEYPDATCSLTFSNPFELTVATILSAQCTDERVNMVTPNLFARFGTPAELAEARQEEVEELIKSTGFFRNKAKSIIGMADALVDRHGGEVPRDMDALVELPGVGRKTANVVLGNAFGIAAGVVVDTHVKRLSGRLGLVADEDPEKIERALIPIVPRAEWIDLPHLFIAHGRAVCRAPIPRCESCILTDLCPTARIDV